MENLLNDPEYKARLWAKSHPEFIRPGADILKVKKVKPMDKTVAQTIKTPTGMPKRFICKYCDKTFAYKAVYQRHLTRCTVQLNNDTIKPAVSEDLLRAIAEDTAKPYKPQTGAPWPGTFNINRHPDPIDYLIMAILSAVALCLMVAAALGIKLLVGL